MIRLIILTIVITKGKVVRMLKYRMRRLIFSKYFKTKSKAHVCLESLINSRIFCIVVAIKLSRLVGKMEHIRGLRNEDIIFFNLLI
jgi:hypothetical protein